MTHKIIGFTLLPLLALMIVPLVAASNAGGTIEGKITDPKGSVVAGAIITVTDPTTNQRHTATSNDQGHYKIEGLPPGTYRVSVAAPGFADASKDDVRVDEGADVPNDFRLEVAAIEETVKVESKGLPPNTDSLYQSLRQEAKDEKDFAGPFATVNNLVLTRQGAQFNLLSGELYFLSPIQGRVTGAVFIGDGVLHIDPPLDVEKQSLKIFTGETSLSEPFSTLVLHFTDSTFDEIKASANVTMGQNGAQAARAGNLFRDNQDLLRKHLRING